MELSVIELLVLIAKLDAMMRLEHEYEYEECGCDLLTFVFMFDTENRETQFIPFSADAADEFLRELECGIGRKEEPIAVELVTDDDEYRCMGLMYIREEPTVEDQAIVASSFDEESEMSEEMS